MELTNDFNLIWQMIDKNDDYKKYEITHNGNVERIQQVFFDPVNSSSSDLNINMCILLINVLDTRSNQRTKFLR